MHFSLSSSFEGRHQTQTLSSGESGETVFLDWSRIQRAIDDTRSMQVAEGNKCLTDSEAIGFTFGVAGLYFAVFLGREIFCPISRSKRLVL
jgi:hypothetical protein